MQLGVDFSLRPQLLRGRRNFNFDGFIDGLFQVLGRGGVSSSL
jgi:hypothetical protein